MAVTQIESLRDQYKYYVLACIRAGQEPQNFEQWIDEIIDMKEEERWA